MPRLWGSFGRGRRQTPHNETPEPESSPLPTESQPLEPQPEPQPEPPSDGAEVAEPGAVWIEDGALHVRNPTALGHWPTVWVPEGIDLVVNGEARTGEVVLQAEDRIVVGGQIKEQPGRLDVEISLDGMAAFVTVHNGLRTAFVLPDMPPDLRIEIRAVRQDEPRPHRFSPGDVVEALREAGVRATPSIALIQQALAAPGTRVQVAEGHPPRSGRSGKVWTVLHGEISMPPESDGDPQFGEGGHPSVEIGEPLAQLEPGDVTGPGRTVTGETVPPLPAWHPTLVAGPGTLLSADTLTAIAEAPGHPVVEFQGDKVFVSVAPELRIAGHLDEGHGDCGHRVDQPLPPPLGR